jgi:hypothetical protein
MNLMYCMNKYKKKFGCRTQRVRVSYLKIGRADGEDKLVSLKEETTG